MVNAAHVLERGGREGVGSALNVVTVLRSQLRLMYMTPCFGKFE